MTERIWANDVRSWTLEEYKSDWVDLADTEYIHVDLVTEKDAEIERLKAENAELRREIGGFSHLSDMRQCMVDAADETERLRKALDQVLQVTGITREYKRVSAIYHPKPLVWLSVPSINGNGGGFRFSVNLDAAAPELYAYLREKEANHGN